MTTTDARPPVAVGQPAPDFVLPAVHREGTVSLADFRGKSRVLLGVFRGVYCPFCRRAIAELGRASERLRAAGVETLAVVATDVENARLYFRLRPARIPMGADPECATHRAYGLPRVPATPEVLAQLKDMPVNPTGELPAPRPILEVSRQLDSLDGFTRTEADTRDDRRQFGQLKGEFLVDEAGIIRWAKVECAKDGLHGFGKSSTADELLAAARTL